MFKYKEKIGEDLKKEARRLGLSEDNWYKERAYSISSTGKFRETAVQACVRDAKRARRENRLWIIAVISALASFFSAIAAWLAVVK